MKLSVTEIVRATLTDVVGPGHALPAAGADEGETVLRLTKLSLAHRTVVLLLSLLIIGLGVYATTALKQ